MIVYKCLTIVHVLWGDRLHLLARYKMEAQSNAQVDFRRRNLFSFLSYVTNKMANIIELSCHLVSDSRCTYFVIGYNVLKS
jgi:hypothetical protein